ncbi:MAG TPA: VOC family protein [Acidimicrobiales bacterium]|jgi:predicted enzyme related to lactoylglutathione lyase|nr:VOC family protein [Acidimicrobiales bacterium]
MSAEHINTGVTIGWVCIDCSNPQRLAGWWQELLGGTVSVDEDGDVRLETDTVPLLFLRVPEVKTVKNRVHLDLRVNDFDRAVARTKSLGASPADDVFVGDRWQVFRDPEGNEFCLIRPTAEGEDGP